jgi:MSHA biogenesis protein MshE
VVPSTKKIYLGKLLLDNKIITQEQLDAAIQQQKSTGERLGQVFIDMGLIKEDQLFELLSQQLNIPYVDLRNYQFNYDILKNLSEFDARRFRAVILNKNEQDYLVGMVDPLDVLAIDHLQRVLKSPIQLALVREDDLLKMIDVLYRHTAEISNLAEELSAELKDNYDITQLGEGFTSADTPVVKLLQTIFEDAVQVNASDIHIEPDEHVLRIRQRIDGVLHEQIMKEKHIASALTLRLKLMGGLNIAEKRLPQDGRFSIKVKNKNFDVRLSTMPVQYGESVVMRLLNQSAEMLSLSHIGLPDDMLKKVRKIFNLPNGLLIVTGPTGSGKTTTLYGMLSELNTPQEKIITVEDPVEYRLPRINQIQVQSKINLDFARILRSVLRQDPDIIMIGELRDHESASIAIRAAMTGHLVLTTLHTNDAVSSAVRLLDMGAEGYIVATVLRAILAQRLVRRVCPNCIVDHVPTPHELAWIQSVNGFHYSGQIFKEGTGCAYCHNSGYKGQVGIFELLDMTPPLIDALRKSDTTEFSRLVTEDKQFCSLALSGLELAEKGITSISEVIRIIGENSNGSS